MESNHAAGGIDHAGEVEYSERENTLQEGMMRYSKPVLTVVIVLMILSLNFSAAGAQSPVIEDPEFTQDDASSGIPDLSTFKPFTGEYVPPEGLNVDATISPLYPNAAIVYTSTPKFFFSKVAGATKYMLAVYDVKAETWVYDDYEGTGNCGDGYCWLQPATKLKTFTYLNNSGGVYNWQVAAYTGTEWVISGLTYFYVYSSGFNSTFSSNAKKWIPLAGQWTLTDTGYYKTLGSVLSGSTALQSEYFDGDFVYEIRLKRKNTTDAVRIYWNGNPEPLISYNRWQRGYLISYSNSDSIDVYKITSGIGSLLKSITTPYLNPYNWNTFTIWRHDTNTVIYINGLYVGYITDNDYTGGWVGVQMTQTTTNKTPLLVDYARVYYSSIGPLNVQYPDGSEFDPATMLPANHTHANAGTE